MDERLLHYYEQELQFLHETGQEFAQDYPVIAGRLGISDVGTPDPSVERLLEGVAFLTARIQLQLEDDFPVFSESLLALVQPEALTPTPSFAVAQFTPDFGEKALNSGYQLPAGSVLWEGRNQNERTSKCQFSTLVPVTFWPIEITEVELIDVVGGELRAIDAGARKNVSLIRIQLRTKNGQPFSALAMDELNFYIREGAGAATLYETMMAHTCGIVVRPGNGAIHDIYPEHATILPGGLLDETFLSRQNSHFSLLKQLFAFPEGHRFVRITGLGPAIKCCTDSLLSVLVLLKAVPPTLPLALKPEAFALFSAPIVNLFRKRCDRVPVEHYASDYPIVVDRSGPGRYQLHQILSVQGYDENGHQLGALRPMFGSLAKSGGRSVGDYSLRRTLHGHMSNGYTRSEVTVSITAARGAEVRQLGITALCSDGVTPLSMTLGKGNTDLVLDNRAPVKAIRLLSGPSSPLSSLAQGEKALRAINLLSRDYLPLLCLNGDDGAQALRELLSLFLPPSHRAGKQWLEGICSLRSETIVRRMAGPGPVVYARGVLFVLELNEKAFKGVGIVLFGAVLEAFLARYVALNSFTELHLISLQRGILMQWRARSGQCPVL